MDIFRRRKFDEAMFARNRTLAIRVGQYQSSDIKEASFDYGYIKGDAYKPGGTCAGSGKIIFSSIITTFNKLDKIYPEIGLLVDGTYEWVKMGEYFINDIEIDRNRKTTKLDLMDGMFKLNREHITSLTYPAEIRQVIKEICLKTGVELANENMDLTSMNYQIEKIPPEKKMTFRDVLSLASQMLGMSCFFNREGKLEIKELTDSGITITADSYFMHGLTKSEIEYRIAGITCKKDKETLTVGLRTGRSLELENRFMSQSILDNLYQNIKDIHYHPYNLNYQGHLLLNVGEWVTIKTNTGESFKSPVLSQSFTFKGGLRGRISADSKAGNDAQYSYAGTLTRKIEQFNEFEKQLQNQFEEADRGHDQKVEKLKSDFDEQIKLAKAKAEEVKQSLTETIDQRFRNFDSAGLREAKQKSDEALTKAGASALLAEEAKRISEQAKDGIEKAKESFLDSFKANSAELDILNDRLKKFRLDHAEFRRSTKEDIKGLTESFTKLGSDTKSDILATRSEFQKTAEGLTQRFDSITSQLDNKANLLDFQRVQETSRLYERIIGSSESDIAEKVARMTLTNRLFQVEVAKNVGDSRNYVKNADFRGGSKNWKESNISGLNFNYEHSSQNRNKSGVHIYGTSINARYFGLQQTFKIELKKSDKITLSFLVSKDGYNTFSGLDVGLHYRKDGAIKSQAWKEISNSDITASTYKKLSFNYELPVDIDEINLMFYGNPGKSINLYISEVKLETGSKATPFTLAPEDTDEAVRTVQNQLAGSWAVQNINSAGDLISGLNLGANGHNRLDGKLTHITGETLIDNAVIKSAMIDKLKTANFETGSVTTAILDAESVTADKLRVDQALFNKLLANEAYLNQLFSKQAFINRVQSVSIDASQIRAGVLMGASITSLDDSMRIDTNKKEFYLNNNTLFTFFDQKEGMHSFIGTGSRAVNGSGSGILIGTGLDSGSTSQLRNNTSNRDLWSARDGMSSSLLIGSKKNGNGQAWITTNGGIYLSASKSKNETGAGLRLGDVLGRHFENKAVLTADDVLISSSNSRIYSSGKMEITGGTGSRLKTSTVTTDNLYLKNKDLVAYFNNLADFVVRIAQNAGWSNVGNYKI
nr:MAG TPA: minor structural protein [Caudoviricetes sp.]